METSGDFPRPGSARHPHGGIIIESHSSCRDGASPVSVAPLGAPMEDLMELVAASFARHGIKCPPGDPKFVEKRASSPVHVGTAVLGCPAEPTALPEHNFRKNLQGDPAP